MREAPVVETVGVYGEDRTPLEAATSGVAWPAIIGGAFAAAALSLILLALGSGFGLASVSPWSNTGASATTFTVMAAIWLIVVQWLASGLGGYLTGRLRTKWVGLHTHEVFFRDTANGFLTWAVATVIGAAFLASAAASVVSGTATVIAGAAKRVDEVIAQAKAVEVKARQAADTARKAGAYLSIFTALSMLVGASIACVAAALGGQQRDEY
jgi:hypothetical protein